MAEPVSATQTDRDLASIAEARALARRAKQAWLELAEFSQERIDAIVDAMAAAATPQAEAFARLAVEAVRIVNLADVRERLLQQGAEPIGSTPEQLAATQVADMAKYARVFREAGVKPE